MDTPSSPPTPPDHTEESAQFPQTQAQVQPEQQLHSPEYSAEPTPSYQARCQEQPDLPSLSPSPSSPQPQPLVKQRNAPIGVEQPCQELPSPPSPNPLNSIRNWFTSDSVLMISGRAAHSTPSALTPYYHKRLRGRYYSDPENYLLTTENEESTNTSSSIKQLSKKRRRNSTHPAAGPPPKPRYILARRRRRGEPQPMPSPWLPLPSKSSLVISRDTPSQWFPRSIFQDVDLDTKDLPPSPMILSNPSPPRLEHTASVVISQETADMLPLATSVETVVQGQLPLTVVLHHNLSPDRNTPSSSQSGIDTSAQQQQQQQELHQPPLPPLHFVKFLQQRRRGHFVTEKSLVVIRICEPSIATKLYSKLAALSNEQGLESVKSLDITLDWSWTQQDLEDLANAVRSCRFSTLTINGGSSRTPLRRRVTSKGVASATLFDPLIELFDLKCLTKIYLSNMPDCLQELSVDFPADMSHIQELQIELDIYNWANSHGQMANSLIRRLTHLERLIVDCPLEKYRAYLMNIWYALRAPMTAPTNTASTVTSLPPKTIQVQLFSRGKMHAEVSFRRPGAAPECLTVDLHNVKDYEVLWHPLLNSSMDQIIHTFRLENAPFNDWITLFLNWLKDREQQVPSFLSSSTASTLNTTNTASTSTSSSTNNATNTSVRLREISLCCSPVRANSEKELLEIIKIATSQTLGLQCLRLIGLHLPLNAPGGQGNIGYTRWSKFFVAAEFWNLEELEIRDSNFDDDQVEWLLLFIMNIKRMKEPEEATWRERQARQGERKRQLELGLVTLEDGEVDEDDGDDAGIARMKLKIIRILGHSLSPAVQSNLVDRLQAMEPPVEVFL